MKKIMLCYPPGDVSRKIKNKYKYNTVDVIPFTMKCCNDLGYMAATVRNCGHEVFLKDYKIENSSALVFLDDILKFSPDMIVMTTCVANILEDLKLVRMIKSSNPEIVVVLKSELFYNPSTELLDNLPLGGVDYLIGSDAAFVLPKLISAHFDNPELLYQIPFITNCRNGARQTSDFSAKHGNINDLPFPARDLIKNEYYYRPDNHQVITTIMTTRLRSTDCLCCNIQDSTKDIIRTAKNVFDEMYECFSKYGIRNFFFPSDTFSHNEKWVEELCDLIINSPMVNNIDWIANVNPATFTEYMATEMKAAGCSIIVIRFDSGSDDSLLRLKRGFTVDECYNSAEIVRKAKIKLFGIYSMGLPWEEESHLEATRKMMLKICSDFVSLAMPVPYPDSAIEKMFRDDNILREPLVTKDGIKIPALGTKFLNHKQVRRYRRKTLLWFYTNPRLLLKKLGEIVKKPALFSSYFSFLIDLFKNKRN